MNRLIIVGSPRMEGRSATLANELFETCIEQCPDDAVSLASVASLDIMPCTGCGVCARVSAERAAEEGDTSTAEAELVDDGGAEAMPEEAYTCPLQDDMADVARALDEADELYVVCPLYFAGPPAQMKALIDRLQPYFYTDRRHQELRPAALHVIGDGHSPHGWEPLARVLDSSLQCAGFGLQTVLDWRGCITEEGEIVADAAETPYPVEV